MNNSNITKYSISKDLADSLMTAPRKIALWYAIISIPVFFYTGYQMFSTQGGPYGANRLWMVGGLALIAISLQALRLIFQHRYTQEVCIGITSMIGKNEDFRRALYKILIRTPWSKFQVSIGRPRNLQMNQIPIMVKGNNVAVMNIAQDLSFIEVSTNNA